MFKQNYKHIHVKCSMKYYNKLHHKHYSGCHVSLQSMDRLSPKGWITKDKGWVSALPNVWITKDKGWVSAQPNVGATYGTVGFPTIFSVFGTIVLQ
jgi:hypothetical protein